MSWVRATVLESVLGGQGMSYAFGCSLGLRAFWGRHGGGFRENTSLRRLGLRLGNVDCRGCGKHCTEMSLVKTVGEGQQKRKENIVFVERLSRNSKGERVAWGTRREP